MKAAQNTFDKSSNVELKAYHDFIIGQHLIEEKDFKGGLEHLVQAKIIFEKIASMKDSL